MQSLISGFTESSEEIIIKKICKKMRYPSDAIKEIYEVGYMTKIKDMNFKEGFFVLCEEIIGLIGNFILNLIYFRFFL
jgi:hypothetical protein